MDHPSGATWSIALLAEQVGVSEEEVEAGVRVLEDLGYLQEVGPRLGGVGRAYVLTAEGRAALTEP